MMYEVDPSSASPRRWAWGAMAARLVHDHLAATGVVPG
jgi:hypothetical protein